jgi:hypothetical protein
MTGQSLTHQEITAKLGVGELGGGRSNPTR